MRTAKLARLFLACCIPLLLAAWGSGFRGGSGGGAPAVCSITGITLSNNTFPSGSASGTVVGAITVATTGPCGTDTISITGTDAASFSLSASTPPANLLTSGVLAGGPYSMNLVATIAGATGSPFTQAETITATVTGFVTSFNLTNTTGSTVSTVLSPVMGLQFKKGDIASGGWPSFQRHDTSGVCPYSQGLKRTWSDGSLKNLSVVVRCPGTVAANASLQVDVMTGGSQPAASSRTTAELSSANIQVIGAGLINLSGTWNATLADAITNGTVHTWMDGDAGKGWIIDGDFKQSGSAQGSLKNRWYVFSSTDSLGALGGIRFVPRVWLPLYNTAAAKVPIAFSSLTMCYGTADPGCSGGTSVAWTWPYNASSFTWPGSGNVFSAPSSNYSSGSLGSAGGHGMVPVVLTTTGSLPAGLSTGTAYIATGFNNASTGVQSSTNIQLTTWSDGINNITPTTGCTGTCTVTPTLTVWPGGSIFGHDANAHWRYDGATGSLAADPPLRETRVSSAQLTYWHSTKTLPPWDMSVTGIATNPTWQSAAGGSTTGWDPVTTGFLGQSPGATGTTGTDLAGVNLYQTQAFFTQSVADELQMRTQALAVANYNGAWRDSTAFALANVGSPNVTYTGFGTNVSATFGWGASGINLTGGSAPCSTCRSTGWVGTGGSGFGDWSHAPATWYFGYLWTGSPEILDVGLEHANMAITSLYPTSGGAGAATLSRNPTWPGAGTTSPYCTTNASNPCYAIVTYWPLQERGAAWALRDIGTAAGVAPDSDPEGIDYKSYFMDATSHSLGYLNANIANASAWTAASGDHVYYAQQNASNQLGHCSSPWEDAYGVNTTALITALTESTDGLAYLSNKSTWYQYQTAHFGDWARYGYYQSQSSDAAAKIPISDDTQWGPLPVFGSGGLAWSSTTSQFTISGNTGQNYVPATGDRYVFGAPVASCSTNGSNIIPGGLTAMTPYYVCSGSVSGTDPATFQLCPTAGGLGTPETLTNSHAAVNPVYAVVPAIDIATGAPAGNSAVGGPESYAGYILSGSNWATALGVSGLSHVETDAANRLTTAGNYTNAAKAAAMTYVMQTSY